MLVPLLRALKKYKDRFLDENYGREILSAWATELVEEKKEGGIRILDVGCGEGGDLQNIKEALKKKGIESQLCGLDASPRYVDSVRSRGFNAELTDIEREEWPVSEPFDLIIVNQVLEHTKEIFWIIGQANQLLKNGGLLFVGVPNLAAWHNRLLLLFGRQPACIRVFSGHFRGFTKKEFRDFLEKYGGFKVCRFSATNIYPLPPSLSRPLSRLFPTFSTTIFFAAQKTGPDNLQKIRSVGLETEYKVK